MILLVAIGSCRGSLLQFQNTNFAKGSVDAVKVCALIIKSLDDIYNLA